MPLTDTACRNARPADKAFKLSDEKALFMLVHPNGGRYWRMGYRFAGKQKTLALGTYPEVSLKVARERRDDARKLLASGVDPSEQKKSDRLAVEVAASNSFRAVSEAWLASQKPAWTPDYHKRVTRQLEANVWPWLGTKPVASLKASEVLECLRRIEGRDAKDMAGRVRETISRAMRFAVASGLAETDPAAALRGALTVHVTKHMASVTDPSRVAELLKMFDAFTGTHAVRTALLLAPMLFCRPGELRQMQWSELDLENGLWELPAARMKTRKAHIVPLSTQAIALLKDIQPLTGHLEHVFPNARDPKRPMSDAAVNAALRRLGIDTQEELTGHGFRAMARTILRERLRYDSEVIECQLAHTKSGALKGAYDRSTFLEERIAMMQSWSDYLQGLKTGNIIQLESLRGVA